MHPLLFFRLDGKGRPPVPLSLALIFRVRCPFPNQKPQKKAPGRSRATVQEGEGIDADAVNAEPTGAGSESTGAGAYREDC